MQNATGNLRGLAVAILLALAVQVQAITPAVAMRKSVVRIAVTEQGINYRVPWNPGAVSSGVGAGFVIDKQRLITNAHVVSNARFLTVEREDDPRRYIAKLEHIAHDCDLAVLKIEDPEFFKDAVPLGFGGLPEIESQVSVYGYPIGGERLSVTSGIVSRVDFQLYSHSGVDAHLAVQISAPINPGNSGGPVVQNGKVIGVAFQGYSGDVAQNVGYMIPVPVIERFLQDIADGAYDRYMDLSVSTLNLQNPAARRALGVDEEDRGILVCSVAAEGSADGFLKPGDVLLAIDGLPISSDAFVQLDGQRLHMSEVVERKLKGDSVRLSVLRDRKKSEVAVPLLRPWRYSMQANSYDLRPRFVLFGGLLFQPLSRDFLEAYQIEDLRVRFYYDSFLSDELYKEHPEVIVLSAILPDPINAYLEEFKNGILNKINGNKIRTLKEAADAFAAPAEHYVIELVGSSRPIVLEANQVQEARSRILGRYRVIQEQNLEEGTAHAN